jgi:crooked neck
VANVPPSKEKRFWRRYIYLWINYAVYEELDAEDVERARQVYRTCLDLLPHKRFTFAKVWLLYAQFEIRQRDVGAARRALGTSLGKCPKAKLFRGYIDLEIQLREFQRCRTLYEHFLLFDPENCSAWMKFAELESLLGDMERARGVYELAVNQPRLDMPELLWKQYIDFEIEQGENDNARNLYRRLLSKTTHVKVWLSLAQFELITMDQTEGSHITRVRKVYEEANQRLREAGNAANVGDQAQAKEFRLMLLEAWRDFELEQEDEEAQKKVASLMPKRVKKRRRIEQDEDAPGGGDAGGWEEYFDYIFPEDEGAKPNLKLLAMAKMWKKQKDVAPVAPEPEVPEEAEAEDNNGKDVASAVAAAIVDPDANPDADDEDIRNESSSSEESDGEADEPKKKRRKNLSGSS